MLMGMIIAVIYTGIRFWRAWRGHTTIHSPTWVQWTILLLAVIGLIIAAYLAYVESQAIAAMCGPVGDCNTVQTSDYAYLFGIPIGVLGVLGYIAILLVWAWSKWQADGSAILLLLGMTTIGVLFSIYLTYLEPFVIGAVCAWCLTSAGIMTLLMLASVETAVSNLSGVQDGD